MKNIFKYLLILSLGVMFFTSCEEDPITLEQKIVGFSTGSGNLNEISSAPIAIPVYNGATSGSGCSVTFSFVTEGIDNPAIEGTDFTLVNSTNSLTFTSNFQTDTIFILPIDNSLYEGNKKVSIALENPTNGFILTNESTFSLNIVDDEHPLAAWIGSYTGTFAGHGPVTMEAYTENQLRVYGLSSYIQTGWGENWVEGDGSCIMDFGNDDTVTILPQWIGDSDYPDVYGIIGGGTLDADANTITLTYELFYGWDGSGGTSVYGPRETVLTKD